jgi:GNAT superfamily N-acetyltransferase
VPWVVRDVVNDVNKAVGKRWQSLDPLLPEPGDWPEGCMAPLVVNGENGRPAGLAVCHHHYVPAGALEQVWGAATRFTLTPRLRGPDTLAALDGLLTQWHDHLAGLPQARGQDTAAVINWPSRDITGVRALLKHGMQAIAVIAVRPAGRPIPAAVAEAPADLVIREARPDDLDAMTELEMGVIQFDAHLGAAIERPGAQALVRAETRKALAASSPWAWLAERRGRPVGLVHVQPPQDSAWIANMTRPAATAYLQTMFVANHERGGGVGAALVRHVHAELDARGIAITLLHYAQLNPLSAPFWSRMGYRPLWTSWEAQPAATLRLPRASGHADDADADADNADADDADDDTPHCPRPAKTRRAARRPGRADETTARHDRSWPGRNAERLLMVASENKPTALWLPDSGNVVRRTRGSRLAREAGEVPSASQPGRGDRRGIAVWHCLGDAGDRGTRGQPQIGG